MKFSSKINVFRRLNSKIGEKFSSEKLNSFFGNPPMAPRALRGEEMEENAGALPNGTCDNGQSESEEQFGNIRPDMPPNIIPFFVGRC